MEQGQSENGRMDRVTYFMKIAEIVAERSTCSKAKVGAVLVDPQTNRIVATGFNGSISGDKHCIDVGCLEIDLHNGHGPSCIRTIHAELNAVLHLERRYDWLTLYTTHQPCYHCIKPLMVANVKAVWFLHPYKDEARDMFLENCSKGISFTQYKAK